MDDTVGSTSKLRVCHLISGDLWAGAEVVALQLICGLNALPGIEVCAVLLNPGRLAEELESAGVPTRVFEEGRRSFPEIFWSATRAVRKWAPHVLHSHRYKENLLAYLVSLCLRDEACLVTTQHGLPELYQGRPGLLHRLRSRANYRLLATKFEKTVAVSSDIENTLMRDYGFREERLAVIHNGVRVPEARDRFEARDGFVIGSAGRLFPVKDYPLMVEVAREVNARSGNARFELAGDGPLLEAVRSLIVKHGLQERFLLRGFVDNLGPFYEGLDVYLNTSLHEGIPMSVLEAMAHGVPPVVPRVGGFEEIVTDGVDGYLVDSRNPAAFAEKCLLLGRNEGLRRSMARAARKKILAQFSIERMAGAYLDLYLRMMHVRGSGKHRPGSAASAR